MRNKAYSLTRGRRVYLRIEGDDESESSLTRKEIILKIITPITLVLLTAILGTVLGIWLQNRSFRRNELFRAKLDTITEGRKEAVKVLQDTEETLRQVRSIQKGIHEKLDQFAGTPDDLANMKKQYCSARVLSPSIETIKKVRLRIALVQDYTKEGNNSAVNQRIDVFEAKLTEYINCGQGESCQLCNEQADVVMDSMRDVVASHTQMTNDLLQDQEASVIF